MPVKRIRNILPLLVAILLISVILTPLTVSAAEPIDTGRDSELIIEFKVDGEPVEGMAIQIYRVVDVAANGDVSLCGIFAQYPVDFSGYNQESQHILAQTLNAFAKKDGLKPDGEELTNAYGYAVFSNLKPGVFLVASQRLETNKGTYFLSPSLISIPAKLTAEGQWYYSVTALPKGVFRPYAEPQVISNKVVKIWRDAGSENSRPQAIEVVLLRNGEIYETIRLNAKNNWSYTWEGLYAEDEWLIAELVPDGFHVLISDDGDITAIINTKEKTVPPETDVPDTGVLWWPLPVLVLLGVSLILVGVRVRRGSKNEA